MAAACLPLDFPRGGKPALRGPQGRESVESVDRDLDPSTMLRVMVRYSNPEAQTRRELAPELHPIIREKLMSSTLFQVLFSMEALIDLDWGPACDRGSCLVYGTEQECPKS